jgi:hypothetical protein
MPALDACSLARTDSTCELNILARKLRDESPPPLSVDLTDIDGLAQVEKEMGEESSDGELALAIALVLVAAEAAPRSRPVPARQLQARACTRDRACARGG